MALGDLEVESGGVIQTGPFGSQLHASDYSELGTPVVMPTNIRDLRISADGIARVSDEHVDRLARHRLRAGDIVYSRRGDVEKCALVTDEQAGWLCGTGCLLVRVQGPTVDARCLAYLLSLPGTRAWISQHAIGATMPNLNTEVLREVPVLLPPIEEQRGTAATLGALDDKIESNRRSVETANNLLDAFTASFADSAKSVPLSQLVTVERTPVDPSDLDNQQVDHFSLPAFDDGVRPDRVAASTIMSGKLAVKGPSILVSRLNPRFNRTWWAAPSEGVPSLASTEFACLTANSRADLAAVWLAVRDEYFRTELVRRASGTSGSHQRVRPDDLLAIKIPDVRELSVAAKNDALALLDLIHARRVESAMLAQVRDALLPELLSGRIRVPEAWEAVAEAMG